MPTRRSFFIAGITAAVALVPGIGSAGPLDTPGAIKALTCSACHGANGNSTSASMPILAGMAPAYFKKAIEDYAAGKRPSPEMEPYAKMTIQMGVDDIANHFASQPRQPTAVRIDSSAAARGKNAAGTCVSCHGAEGRGDPAKNMPALAGQPPGYLRNQMQLFKTGTRSPGDPVVQAMKAMMKDIPDQALDDLAAYYSSLR